MITKKAEKLLNSQTGPENHEKCMVAMKTPENRHKKPEKMVVTPTNHPDLHPIASNSHPLLFGTPPLTTFLKKAHGGTVITAPPPVYLGLKSTDLNMTITLLLSCSET